MYPLFYLVPTVHSRAESHTSISSVNTVDDVSMDFERTIAVCQEEVMRAEQGIMGYHVWPSHNSASSLLTQETFSLSFFFLICLACIGRAFLTSAKNGVLVLILSTEIDLQRFLVCRGESLKTFLQIAFYVRFFLKISLKRIIDIIQCDYVDIFILLSFTICKSIVTNWNDKKKV